MNTAPMHANASSPREVACLVCEAVFVPRKPWAKFCSSACRNRFHHDKRTVEALTKRVESLEQQMEMVRGHLVI